MPTTFHQKSVTIIGAGWFGVHTALHLKLVQPDLQVILLDKNSETFSGTSGKFGIRLHAGPHYPRSGRTRESCHSGFNEFLQAYPELLNTNAHAYYALGKRDSDGHPSKVGVTKFAAVCREFAFKNETFLPVTENKNFQYVADLDEPCAKVGKFLHSYFSKRLEETGVQLMLNFNVSKIEKLKNNESYILQGSTITSDGKSIPKSLSSNIVINATGFQTHLLAPEALPFGVQVVHQVCLGLLYSRKQANGNLTSPPPISFIVMDGWFPCLMPYDDQSNADKYVLTHGKHTIWGTFPTPSEALSSLANLTEDTIRKSIASKCEQEMEKYWPSFNQQFTYTGWIGTVLAKLRTEREFRSAFAFQSQEDGVIYTFPGKINNVFDVAREVAVLAGITKGEVIQVEENCKIVRGGELNKAVGEVTEEPKDLSRCTVGLRRSSLG